MSPTGDPDMPDDVRQAKSIKYLIGEKANLIDVSPQFDLQNGQYIASVSTTAAGADINEPTQQHLLGKPTQLTQIKKLKTLCLLLWLMELVYCSKHRSKHRSNKNCFEHR